MFCELTKDLHKEFLIEVMFEFEPFCTLCSIKCLNFHNISGEFCDENRIDNLIVKYLHIEIQNDVLCLECFEKLSIFDKYYKRVHEAQETVKALILNNINTDILYDDQNELEANDSNKITDKECIKGKPRYSVNYEIEQLQDSKEVDYHNEANSSIIRKNNSNKNEECLSLQITKDLIDKEMFQYQEKNTRVRAIKRNYLRKTKQINDSDIRKEEKETENRISFMTQEDFKNIDYDAEEHDDKISNFMQLICVVCNEKFPCFNRIMRHYHNIHKIRGYISCCELKFYTRMELIDHIDNYHLNSERLKCHLCGKKLGNTRSLKRHMISIHNWKKEELYPCDICLNTSFSKRIDLKKHKFEVHSSDKFICLKCKRSFKGERKLRLHEENIHNREPPSSIVCDLCGKVFKTSGGFYKHTKEIHEGKIKGREECDKCGSLVKNLEFHKKMAHPPDGTIIKCDECNKIMKTWFALKSHRENVHRIDKRKFLCKLCDKGFKNQKLLLEHIASHTGQPLYTCTYCPTTFKHESNYLKHKKRQHTSEWAEERRLKYLNLKNNT